MHSGINHSIHRYVYSHLNRASTQWKFTFNTVEILRVMVCLTLSKLGTVRHFSCHIPLFCHWAASSQSGMMTPGQNKLFYNWNDSPQSSDSNSRTHHSALRLSFWTQITVSIPGRHLSILEDVISSPSSTFIMQSIGILASHYIQGAFRPLSLFPGGIPVIES